MEKMKVRTPQWTVSIAGKDVTSAIMSYVKSVTYSDSVAGSSDEVDLVLEDSTGVWRTSWYPSQGDAIVVAMGYAGEQLMPCGSFEIEEIEISGPEAVMHIRALASGVTPAQRTKRSQAYEGASLREVATTVARRHGFRVLGDIPDVRLNRITQNQETDLSFVKRLAGDYGHVFSVKGDQLVFSQYAKLRQAAPVLTLNRVGGVASYSLRDQSLKAYKDCECSYDDPKTKTCHTHRAQASGAASGDTCKITRRCENAQQAKLQAEAELERQNDGKYEGTINCEGNTRLVAGNTVALAGFGRFDGTYLIDSSRHSIEQGKGYATEITIKRGYEEAGNA
jgi:phage protein D